MYSPSPFKKSYFDTHSPKVRSVTWGFEGYPQVRWLSPGAVNQGETLPNKFLSLQEEQAWPWPWHGKKEGEHGAKHPIYIIYYIKVDRWFEKQNIRTYHIISYHIISYHIITDNYVIVLPMPPAWMFTGDGLEKVECTKQLGFQVGTCVTSPVGFQVPPNWSLGLLLMIDVMR